jgi:hypothetical protein
MVAQKCTEDKVFRTRQAEWIEGILTNKSEVLIKAELSHRMFTAQDDWLKFPVKCLNAQ